MYRQFLEILQLYQREKKAYQEVYGQIVVLFKNSADLIDEFKQFLPDTSRDAKGAAATQPAARKCFLPFRNTSLTLIATPFQPMPVDTFPKRREPAVGSKGTLPGVQPLKKKQRTAVTSATRTQDNKLGTMEELEFFDKVKRAIGSRTTYNEFLKILNLFSQEIIDSKTLVERVTPFLERTPELLDWFKKFVKYEDDDFVCKPFLLFDTPHLYFRECSC